MNARAETPSVEALLAGKVQIGELSPLDGITLLIQAVKVFGSLEQLESILAEARLFWTVHPNDLDRVNGVILALGERLRLTRADADAAGVSDIATEMLKPMVEFRNEYRSKIDAAKGRGL